MQIDWWTLGLQTINLLVLVWILSRFLFRPIADIVAKRKVEAASLLENAEKVRRQAIEAEQAAERAAAEAAQSRSELIAAATAEAETEKKRLFAQARRDADDLRNQANRDIEKMRAREASKNEVRASMLAVDIARRLFARLPEEALVSGFVDGLVQELRKISPEARKELAQGSEGLQIKVARQLTSDEEETLLTAVSSALGRDVRLTPTVDPSLIAGLEIETPHVAVRNSFRSDLERIAAELASNDAAKS